MARKHYIDTLGFCKLCNAPLRGHDFTHGPRDGSCYRCALESAPSIEDTHAHLTTRTTLERGLHQSRSARVAAAVRARRA